MLPTPRAATAKTGHLLSPASRNQELPFPPTTILQFIIVANPKLTLGPVMVDPYPSHIVYLFFVIISWNVIAAMKEVN